ncbi:hypothetical protein TUBRATIS_28320 [Tubulinosema ratisbonensis]|uniref:Uncharacterized protein n=1 Tax=Tubulinosema ratisbonensis TaxID=291195 RepID=A0A437AHT1_9MICR|nr:hypothetical protein TUBRATIS_28320 [Tubulinosema ratisbonensis]
MVVMYASHDVKNHTFIIPYDVNNMILQTMYLSRILLLSMIYDTKQHPDSLPEFKLFLYAIHLKVQYFHSKLLPEILIKISDSEKDFLNVSSSNYESLYRYLTS